MKLFSLFRKDIKNEHGGQADPPGRWEPPTSSLFEYANGVLVAGGSYAREASSTWPVIHRCVNIISGVSARLLVDSARIIDRDRKQVTGSSANRYLDLIKDTPDQEIDSYTWLIDCFADMALSGNVVLLKRRGMMGNRTYLDLCQPDYTNITWENEGYRFRVRPDRQYEAQDIIATLDDIVIGRNPRISGRMWSGTPKDRFLCPAPIQRLSQMLMIALNADAHVSKFFDTRSGAVKSDLAITYEQVLDKETQEGLRNAIKKFMEGRAPLLLTGDPKIQNLAQSAQDSQTLQLREFSISDCGRALGVPDVFLSQNSGNVWSSSTAALAVALHRYTIAPYISQFLEPLSFKLLPRGWKFDVDMGRVNVGDLELLSKILPNVSPKSGAPDAILTRNEARAMLGIDADYQSDWLSPDEVMPGMKNGNGAA